ncbi:hypothetical protein LUZ60_015180 [Juncus effusus]|nr:hypothetical protein LUZ60_015180 [Juncus effusus]
MSSPEEEAAPPPPPPSLPSPEETAARTAQRRFEGLTLVRAKAVKGKGAWYWVHLEPTLVRCPETGRPISVRLRCSLCGSAFSASNPSRTASEHLKRGTCPSFGSSSPIGSNPPQPINSVRPLYNRKRPLNPVYHAPALLPAPPLNSHPIVLSGGKDDFGALQMLEDSVKRLKTPNNLPSPPILTKHQIDSALTFLSDWFYESCNGLSVSSIEHPKFKSFLQQVGLPAVTRKELTGIRLETRFAEARSSADARLRDALFFQLSVDGWRSPVQNELEENVVSFSVNLPNGTQVFHRTVLVQPGTTARYAEELMWDTVVELSGTGTGDETGTVHRCAGIVSDRYKMKALKSLEDRYHWMVNLSCQYRAFRALIKDLYREIPLVYTVCTNCAKLATYFNTASPARNIFQKYRVQDPDGPVSPLRVFTQGGNFSSVLPMLDDLMSSARIFNSVLQDESFKVVCLDDQNGRDLAEMVRDRGFWADLEAVHSVLTLIEEMSREIEEERPLVGRCLPLWEELRSKVKDLCVKFGIDEGPVKKVLEKRFKKNYHPAWSAAFILDPLYLIKDSTGKYLPPFKYLSPEQEKDVDRLITRMATREEAHIALMELMKWRSEGLDPLYARAVQVRKPDPFTGKMRVVNPQSSRLVWETYLSEFRCLNKIAVRLIFLRGTSCGVKCNLAAIKWGAVHGRNRVCMDRVHKMVYVGAHVRGERKEGLGLNDEERDLDVFVNGESEEEEEEEEEAVHDSVIFN